MSSILPQQGRLPVGPGMRACGNCGAGTPLGSPDGMCQGCRDERDEIRAEARRRLAAASQTAPVPMLASSDEEPQEYVDDLPPMPAPAPRPMMRPNPMTFPGQGPSPLRPISSGANNKVRRRHTGPLKVGEHRFAPERVGYQGVNKGQGTRRKSSSAAKAPSVVIRHSQAKGGLPWGAMMAGLILAVGLGGWALKGGVAKANAPTVAFTPVRSTAHQAQSAPAPVLTQAIAQPARLPDRDEALRIGAAVLGSSPAVRYSAPAPAYAPVRYAAPAAAAPVASAYRIARTYAAAPSYRYAAAPRPARAYRYAAAPRHAVRHHAPRNLAEAMVLTSRPGPAPGAPRRQGGVEVIGW